MGLIHYLQPQRNQLARVIVILWCWMLVGMGVPVYANPTSGQVVGGSAGIASNGNTLTVTQTTDRAIINWQSFSIASGETTQFLQPSATSAVLNRVVGDNLSEIYGTLSANGKVYLINPNGVIIGASGVINTAGFVASTLDVNNAAFLAGKDLTFSGTSTAMVQNLGHIGVGDGDVFLIARQVENHGTIEALNGEVGLAGGTEILLKSSGSDKLMILPGSGSGSVSNEATGQIRAAMVALKAAGGNEYALAVNNGGLIRATGTSKVSGKVYLTASSGKVRNTGTVTAREADGTGGTIETCAPTLSISGTIDAGVGGFWLIDPTDIIIASDSTSTVDVTTLLNTLNAGTSVTESASNSVSVNTGLTWSGTGNLTLSASNLIQINAAITATNGGLIIATKSKSGVATSTADIYVNSFALSSGLWEQVASDMGLSALPKFYAKYFNMPVILWGNNGYGTFLRALAGDGTTANPYQLTDIYGVQGINSTSRALIARSFILANDIDASMTQYWNSGTGFSAIGLYDSTPFTGTLDGKGYIIDGLTIKSSSYAGLFAFSNGSISNLSLTNVNIMGASYYYTGALVAYMGGGSITNCYVSGSVTNSSSFTGGMVGYVNSGTIRNCSASVIVTGGGNYTGGLVGCLYSGNISNSYATGTVSSNTQDIGGLIGCSLGTVKNSSASVTVTGTGSLVGGLIGMTLGGSVNNCSAQGSVTASAVVGGLIGYNAVAVSNSYATGNVTSLATSGNSEAGGLIGEQANASISYCYATGNVYGYANHVGGLVGYTTGSVQYSYATGNVTGQDKVGGLVGDQAAKVDSCYATGNVTGRWYIGGVSGSLDPNAVLSNVYSTGNVSGSDSVGGLVGYAISKSTIKNGYVIGTITASNANNDQQVGAIVGTNWGNVSSCYYATDSTGMTSAAGYSGSGSSMSSVGTTLANMKTNQSLYSGWDFTYPTGNNDTLVTSGIWVVDESGSVNSGLPCFQWQHPILVVTAVDQTVPYLTRASTTAVLNSTYTVAGLLGTDTASNVLTGVSLSITGTNVNVGTTNSIVISATQTGTKYILKKVNGTEAFSAIDLIIDSPLAATIMSSLSSTNVTYDTNYRNIYVESGINWSSTGTLTLGALGNIQISYDITAANGTLSLKAANTITDTAAVSVKNFLLTGGTWTQVAAALPSFYAQNFATTSNGAFLRALGGDGSSASPYQITDLYGLQGISGSILSKCFILANDINLSAASTWNNGAGFSPIGSSGSSSFSGTFDGNGYTISNLTINRPTSDYVGLFGHVSSSGIVQNVTLTNASIVGGQYIGALVGANEGLVYNSFASATVSSTLSNAYYVGGLIGNNSGTVSRSSVQGTVTALSAYGVGGLIGGNAGTVRQSYANVAVSGKEVVGGFVGENYGTVAESYALGTVYSKDVGGAFAGSNIESALSLNYATGKVTAVFAGGFVGLDDTGSYSANYFSTDGTGLSQADSMGLISSGVTGLTTAQMKNQSNYSSAWNYTLPTGNGSTLSVTGTWVIDDSGTINGGLPVFQWKYPVVVAQAMDQAVPGGTTINTTPVLGTTYTVAGLIGTDTASAILSGVTLSVSGTNVDPGTTNSIVIGATQAGTKYILKTVNGTQSFLRIDLTIDSALAALIMSSLSSTNVTFSSNAYDNIYVQSGITWGTGYTLTLDAYTNLQISSAITANNGSLVVKAGSTILAEAAISVKNFTLAGGNWTQVASALPAFYAQNFSVASGSTFLRAQGGDGSSSSPYQIVDVYGLQGIAISPTTFLSKSYIQMADIDASMTSGWNGGAGFITIGSTISPFSGTYDGNGYVINGLTINAPAAASTGLFASVSSYGLLQNIHLANATITGGNAVGGLTGYNQGSILSCTVTGTVASTGSTYVGGLAGENYGVISDSSFSGSVSGDNITYLGGLAGENYGVVSDSNFSGSVSGDNITYLGGLAGENYGVISGSGFSGSVSGDNITYLGGLAGLNEGTIYGSNANAAINGGSNIYYMGGLVGVNDGSIEKSSATGSALSQSYITCGGGLVGVNTGSITQSDANVSVTAVYAGGLVGYNVGTISISYAVGAVSSDGGIAGGLVGYNQNGSVSISYAAGSVIATGGAMSGGLIGYDDGGTYSDNYFATDGTGQSYAEGTGATLTGVTARTLAQLKDQSTYSIAWNFTLPTGNNGTLVTSGIWGTDDAGAINNGLPVFQREHPYLILTSANQTVTYGSGIQTSGILGTTYTIVGLRGTDTTSSVLSSVTLSVNGTNVNVGTTNSIAVSATQNGTTYLIKKVSATESFTQAEITVTANGGSSIYGDASSDPGLSATGLASWDTVSVLTGLSNSYGISATTDAGTYTLSVAGALTNGNYKIVSTNTGSWVVTPANITVTANGGTSIYGDASSNPGLSAMGLKNGQDSTVLTGLSNSYGISATTDAGTYTLSVAGTLTNGNYKIVATNTGSWIVTPAAITVTANGGTSIYGDASSNPGLSATGLKNGQDVSILTGLSNSYGISAATDAGTYTLSVAGALTNGNYKIVATNTGSWIVTPADITVIANGGTSIYGDASSNPGLSATGLKNGQDVSILTGLSNSYGISATADAGTYTLSVAGALTNGNYKIIATNTGSWSVTPAPITVIANGGRSSFKSDPINPGLSAIGLKNGQDVSVLTDLTNSFGITSSTILGSYTLTVSGSLTNSNYQLIGTQNGTWVVYFDPGPAGIEQDTNLFVSDLTNNSGTKGKSAGSVPRPPSRQAAGMLTGSAPVEGSLYLMSTAMLESFNQGAW